MANLTKGFDFTGDPDPERSPVTVNALHALVDAMTLSNVTQSALVSGLHFVNRAEPGGPSDGDNFIDTDGLLKFYNGTSFETSGVAAQTVTMTNTEGATLTPGQVVVVDESNDASVKLSNAISTDFRVFGVVSEEITNGSDGQIYVRGVVPMLVYRNLSDTPAGGWIKGPFVSRDEGGSLEADPTASPNFNAAHFAVLLEPVTGGSTSSLVTVWAKLWR